MTRKVCQMFYSILTTAFMFSVPSYSAHGALPPGMHNRQDPATSRESNDKKRPDVNQLIADLSSPRMMTRVIAVRALGSLGEKAAPAVPELIDYVRGDDVRFGAEAAFALGKIGSSAHVAIPMLREIAGDTTRYKNLRVGAITALGEFGCDAKQAIPELVVLLADDRIDVRQASAQALSKMGSKVIPVLTKALADGNTLTSTGAASALSGLGVDAVAALMDALNDARPAVRGAAAQALGKCGPDAKSAVPALIELLKDDTVYGPNIRVRSSAAYALGGIGPGAAPAVPALVELLRMDRGAARALGRIGPAAKPAVPALVELLGEPDYIGRGFAVEALGGIGPGASAAVPALLDLLKQETGGGRANVAKAIGQIQAAAAVPPLIDLLRTEKIEIRSRAVRALQELGSLARPAIPQLLELVLESDKRFSPAPLGPAATRAMVLIDPDSIRLLVEALTSDPETAFLASSALGQIGRDALPAIIDALRGDDSDLCIAAIRVLHRMKDHVNLALPDLERLIGHPNASVSESSREFLSRLVHDGTLDDSVLLAALTKSLKHPSSSVRARAASQLGRFGGRASVAIPDLIDMLHDEQRSIRSTAVRTLAEIGPAAAPAVPSLLEILRSADPALPAEAAAALGSIGDAAKVAIPDLIEAVGRDDIMMNRRKVAEALVKLEANAKDAIPALLKARARCESADGTLQSLVMLGPDGVQALAEASLSDTPRLRLHTAEVLGGMGADGVAALPVLIDLLHDEQAYIRKAAASSIGRIGPSAKSALPALEQAANDEDETVRRAAKWASGAVRRWERRRVAP